MVKGSEVQTVTHSFVLLPLIYISVLEHTGELLIAFKGNWQKPPCKAVRASLFTSVSIPPIPPDLSSALLTSTRGTHLATLAFSPAIFFPYLWVIYYSWEASYGLSIGTAYSAGPGCYYSMQSVFPGLNWLANIYILPLWLDEELQQSCSRSQNRDQKDRRAAGLGQICKLNEVSSQPSWKSSKTHSRMCRALNNRG